MVGLINLGAGLSAMGKSVSEYAGNLGLLEERAMLERQSAALAATTAASSEDRAFKRQKELKQMEIDADAVTDLTPEEIDALGLPKGTVAQKSKSGAINVISKPTAEKDTPYTDLGKLNADFEAGRISQGDYDAQYTKLTKENPDASEPLVEVSDGQGGSIYLPRSQAIGKAGKGGKLTMSDVVAPILQAIAEGKQVTPAQQKALDTYQRLSAFDVLGRSIVDGGNGAGDDVLGDTAPLPTPARPAASSPVPRLPNAPLRRDATGARPPKPAQYPDAQWSDKVGGWVIQQNNQWFKVEP